MTLNLLNIFSTREFTVCESVQIQGRKNRKIKAAFQSDLKTSRKVRKGYQSTSADFIRSCKAAAPLTDASQVMVEPHRPVVDQIMNFAFLDCVYEYLSIWNLCSNMIRR